MRIPRLKGWIFSAAATLDGRQHGWRWQVGGADSKTAGPTRWQQEQGRRSQIQLKQRAVTPNS